MKKFRIAFLAVSLACIALTGCAVKLVADYDSATFEETLKVGKKVDQFYGGLLEIPVASRPYKQFADKYVEIETDIRSLVTRNESRALNADSTAISEIILKYWLKYKTEHTKNDGYSEKATIDRERFQRLFKAAANAESAKNLETADKKPDAGNK